MSKRVSPAERLRAEIDDGCIRRRRGSVARDRADGQARCAACCTSLRWTCRGDRTLWDGNGISVTAACEDCASWDRATGHCPNHDQDYRGPGDAGSATHG